MIIKVTSPKNGATWTCKTRKEAAQAALCSVGRIGEIVKANKDTTLRNGYRIELFDGTMPSFSAEQVARIIKKQAQWREDYVNEKAACTYEEWKDYFAEDRQCAFAAQVLSLLD